MDQIQSFLVIHFIDSDIHHSRGMDNTRARTTIDKAFIARTYKYTTGLLSKIFTVEVLLVM